MAQKLMLGSPAAAPGMAPAMDVSVPAAPAGLGRGLGSRQGLGTPKGPLRRRQKAGGEPSGVPLVHSGRMLTARASSKSVAAAGAAGGGDAFLEEVEELPDGSLVLHYSSEAAAARRKEGRLVSFLTKPLPGQSRREVPRDVLQQILGGEARGADGAHNGASASVHSQPQGLASFMKGVLAPSEHNGRAATREPQPPAASPSLTPPAVPRTGASAAHTAAAAASSQQTATAPPSPSPSATVGATQLTSAAPSETGASEAVPKRADSPQETSSGQSGIGRAVTVALAAATLTAVLRGLALVLGPAVNVPVTAPVSLYASAAVFVVTSLFLWITGFASTAKAAPKGALA